MKWAALSLMLLVAWQCTSLLCRASEGTGEIQACSTYNIYWLTCTVRLLCIVYHTYLREFNINCSLFKSNNFSGLLHAAVFEEKPSNMSCPANDTVRFKCSVHKGEILWFVNDTFVLGLPPALNASFKTTSLRSISSGAMIIGESSTLEFIAKAEANNSQIVCAVGINNKITEMRTSAKLTGEKLI